MDGKKMEMEWEREACSGMRSGTTEKGACGGYERDEGELENGEGKRGRRRGWESALMRYIAAYDVIELFT